MSQQVRIRVFSVDDHPLLREGIAAIINNQPDMLLVAQASNGCEAIQLFRQHQPDVTLMDLRLPDKSGIDSLIAIRAEFPEARVIMLTTFEGDVEIQRALEAGARGYMLKSMPPKELVEVISRLLILFVVIIVAAIVLLGPGAFSLDARLFGRREIIIPHASRSLKS